MASKQTNGSKTLPDSNDRTRRISKISAQSDSAAKRGSLTSQQDLALQKMSQEVERMSSVFEEAEKAREERRKQLDELHDDTMRRIRMTRDYTQQEAKRTADTMKSFEAKFGVEMKNMRDELLKELNDKSAIIEGILGGLEERMCGLEKGLEQQTVDRKHQMESVLGKIGEEVGKLTADLDEERKTRQRREEELMKELADAIEAMNLAVDAEKFSREQQYMDFKQWAHSQQERLGKRQYEVERETNDSLGNLREGLQDETQDRIECQDGIVENITLFVKRFQDNIKEE
jgi:hypothetical protein